MKTKWFYQDEDIMIGVDDRQWIIATNKKGRNPKTGKTGSGYYDMTYYPTLPMLLESLSESQIRESMGSGKKTVLGLLDDLKTYIKKIVGDIEL